LQHGRELHESIGAGHQEHAASTRSAGGTITTRDTHDATPETRGGTPETYNPGGPFEVRDCALAAIATGRHAQNLKELRDELHYVDPASIYYHFWGGLLRPTFDDPRFHNDFARWAHDALHDNRLAERLSVIDPTNHPDLESLRQSVIDVVEDEIDTTRAPAWTSPERRFLFIRSQIVIFDTPVVAEIPAQLPGVVASMSPGSVFYHFVDARRRTPNGVDDFSTWLTDIQSEEYAELCTTLEGIDPFFRSLSETRSILVECLEGHFGKEGGA
jgi:hypothetical protein